MTRTIALIDFILRVIGSVYCVSKANKLNRSSGGWGFFGFVLPIVAMIWIQFMKRLTVWEENSGTKTSNEPINEKEREAYASNALERKPSVSSNLASAKIRNENKKNQSSGYKLGEYLIAASIFILIIIMFLSELNKNERAARKESQQNIDSSNSTSEGIEREKETALIPLNDQNKLESKKSDTRVYTSSELIANEGDSLGEQWFWKSISESDPYIVIGYLNKAISYGKERFPNYATAFNNRGVCKKNLGDYQGALVDFNTAIIESNLIISYLERGECKLFLNDRQGAIEDLNVVINSNQDNTLKSMAYLKKGFCLMATDKNAACKCWSVAAEMGSREASDDISNYCN